ncbi:MAG TPA: hypothetical protein VH601_17705 [Bryobacteraceae bacterium]|jgi:hypothetical protein
MKRIQTFAAVNIIAALLGAGVPALAAQHGYDLHGRAGMQSRSSEYRDRHPGNDDRWDRDHHDGWRDREPAYVYAPAPVYRAPAYDDNYYYDRQTHNGRTAAIIGGSAAAGAVIGAAVGHGQGAVIGAVIGGIAGTVASATADHHDRY